ncbi:MAG TPA: rhodanese-like domain-containing protein, partial [Rectinemataceae bacterium]|nr:rhodanese-like domain-containing protein [Rectinemataceae bacterium]
MDNTTVYLVIVALAAWLLVSRLGGVKKAPSAVTAQKIASGARVIDVRSRSEFASGAYRKAKNIPLDEIAGRLGELGPKDGAIVVYCASGARSSKAARILMKAGFGDVTNAGGLGAMP